MDLLPWLLAGLVGAYVGKLLTYNEPKDAGLTVLLGAIGGLLSCLVAVMFGLGGGLASYAPERLMLVGVGSFAILLAYRVLSRFAAV